VGELQKMHLGEAVFVPNFKFNIGCRLGPPVKVSTDKRQQNRLIFRQVDKIF
jgi:hypothetical protein